MEGATHRWRETGVVQISGDSNEKPKLWGRASSVNVQKVMWALAELNVDYERIDAGGKYGRTDSAEFATLNPTRRVPVWQENELVLWESHAILRHLARSDLQDRLRFDAKSDQWMEFTTTTLQPPFIGVFWQVVRTPQEQRSAAAAKNHMASLNAALDILETRLAQRAYIAGPELSIADIAAGALMYRYYDMNIDRKDRPALRRWYELLTSRQAYRDTVMTSYDELRA